jgi:hypothetical protein
MENSQTIMAYEIINSVYKKGVKPLIVEGENYAYIRDPVFEIKRNRVIAETLKAIIRLNLEKDEIILKLCNYLEKNQNRDGSWNEIHPNYSQPSALITSIIGEALLMMFEKFPSKSLEASIHHASRYVLSQEKSPGYFLKSAHYTADHLNADATCGAFLTLYGKTFSDEKCIKIARNTAKHICDQQFSNGSYPYTINKENYSYIFNIPCIHYQGVTMYYLFKINEVIKEKWLEESLIRGVEWLASVQKSDGRFDWSKSGLMFAYYLTGAYAFAFSSFLYISQWDKKYLKNAHLCLNNLKRNIEDLFLRWEKDSWATFPFSIPITLRSALMGDYPFKYKVFRFGYGMYRQMARRRFSKQPNDKIFKNIIKIMAIQSSTIEPFNNYTDLFITSEVIDCLSNAVWMM